MLNKQLFGAISFEKIWILKLSKNVGENKKITPPNWSAHFVDKDQREISRATKEFEDPTRLISNLQLGQYEMPFENYLIMEGENIIEVEYCMS